MGIDFSIGKPQPTLEEDFAILESHPVLGSARPALERIKQTVEEEIGMRRDHWEYIKVDFDDRAHWAYSGFMRFRERIAKMEGIDLQRMDGFGPMNDLDAYLKMHPEMTMQQVTPAMYEGAEKEFYAEWTISWKDVETTLEPFLHHSDCDGEMTPEECAQVLPRLEECVKEIDEEWEAERGQKLVNMMRICVEQDAHLLFR